MWPPARAELCARHSRYGNTGLRGKCKLTCNLTVKTVGHGVLHTYNPSSRKRQVGGL